MCAARSPKRAAAWRSARDAGPESLALVNPVVASPEIGENLVANGPHAGGEVVDAYAVANEGGKIAAARGALGKMADVDRQQVHRYAAGDGATLPGDDDLGCGLAPGSAGRPQEAIRVSDRDHGDTAWPRGGEGCAITDGFALVDRAHLDDPPLELDHRPHRVFFARGRVDAVDRHARPDQVAIRGAAEEYARGIGKRGRHTAIQKTNFAKQPDLAVIHRVIGDLGAGEMADQQRETMIFRLQARGDGNRLVRGDAEPVHAGVDVESGATAPVLDGDERIPFGKFGRAVDDRPQIIGCEC